MTPQLLFTLMRRSARAARPERNEGTGESVVRYSRLVRGVGWGILGLGAVSAVVVLPQMHTRHDILVAGVSFSVFLLGAVAIVREFTEVRDRWSADTLTSIAPWRGERSIRWDEVTSVKFSRAASWFVVRGADGTVIRLPTWLGGLRLLVEEMRWRCPPPVQGRVEDAIRRWERWGS